MEAYVTPCIATKTGYLRLRFPELRDWSGEIHVTGVAGDPTASLLVSVRSDAGFAPLDVRIEESRDGVSWTQCAPPTRRVDVVEDLPRSHGPDADPQAPRRE
jgi:hypothetical protein